MNPILYLDAYTIIFQKNVLENEIYQKYSISKNKQKTYPIIEQSILFPIEEWKPKAVSKPLEIVYEDETLLVVNKPAFILVHSDGNDTENLQDYVNAYLFDQGWPHKAQAIHRLDYETSGLLLFCKNPFFQAYYDALFASSHPEKEYYALVKKNFPFKEKEIKSAIGRDRHDARKMRISPSGKEATSYITRIQLGKDSSLLNVKITTGRKHQIRVHLASLGFPILNDSLYGMQMDSSGLLLQHHKISFFLPDDTRLNLEIPLDIRIQKHMK
ncbi:MAG: RluA family pseudouridine synthase [Firmicutes bacterium]|nr:RluA family pseudouridine synthase [Bacillota bacterium]